MSTNHESTREPSSADEVAGCTHHDRGHRHRHGTRAAYTQDGCRCPSCQRANRAVQQARRRAIAYGRWHPYTDAEPIRAHVTQLVNSGISLANVAAHAGVSHSTLNGLLSTHDGATRPRVRAGTAQRIRQVKPGRQHPALVDSTGAKRRVQALIANGWSMARLAAHVHCHPSTISRLLRGTTVTRNLDHAIREIYNLVAEQPVSTATRGERISVETARRYAEAHGWATPDRWTDIDQDLQPQNAGAETDIDQIAVSQVLDGQTTQLNFRERRLAAQLLTARGLSTRDIAERLAVDPRTVSRYRRAVADLNELTNNKRSLSRPICTEAGSHRRASRGIAGSCHGPR